MKPDWFIFFRCCWRYQGIVKVINQQIGITIKFDNEES